MMISSRTPEGLPNHCPICGKDLLLEPSQTGDGTCPHCGHLLWWFNTWLANHLGANASQIGASTSILDDLGADSLDVVEFVMEFEREFDIRVPNDAVEKIRTVGDAMRCIRNAQSDSTAT